MLFELMKLFSTMSLFWTNVSNSRQTIFKQFFQTFLHKESYGQTKETFSELFEPIFLIGYSIFFKNLSQRNLPLW